MTGLVFLSQVFDPDHSCRAAVARFLAWRAARGQAPCSADPGAYCKARQRLPEGVLARLTRASGRRPQDQAPAAWRWQGRIGKAPVMGGMPADGRLTSTIWIPKGGADASSQAESRHRTGGSRW